jgi:hypothetical protein
MFCCSVTFKPDGGDRVHLPDPETISVELSVADEGIQISLTVLLGTFLGSPRVSVDLKGATDPHVAA